VKNPLKKRAVIFDFDGLIMDSEWPAYVAWSEIYQRFGVSLSLKDWVSCVGGYKTGFDPVLYLKEQVGESIDGEALFAEKEARKAALCELEPTLPGVLERIKEASKLGLTLAVASSSDRQWVDSHLIRLGIRDYFFGVITRSDVINAKPAPDLYLKAATTLDVKAESCIAIEDSLNGVNAAKAAGMFCVAVPNRVTRVLDFAAADIRVDSLANLSLKNLVSS